MYSDEMDALLKHLGINLEKEELQSLLDALDFDGESKGELDFEEFYVCMRIFMLFGDYYLTKSVILRVHHRS